MDRNRSDVPAPAAAASGDDFPAGTRVIEVRVNETRQLFNSMDPSPFYDRDLDPDAEEFIVGTARELPRDAPLGLTIRVDDRGAGQDDAAIVQRAVERFFVGRAAATRQRLRQLFHRGRISLVIGLAFLTTALTLSQALAQWVSPGGFMAILEESLVIGGWVAMWRPIEIFLYDWWPIRADARLFDRLAAMPIRIVRVGAAGAAASGHAASALGTGLVSS